MDFVFDVFENDDGAGFKVAIYRVKNKIEYFFCAREAETQEQAELIGMQACNLIPENLAVKQAIRDAAVA